MAEAGVSGALYRCTRCDEITDAPVTHNRTEHAKPGLDWNDFALRRGSLHNPTGPRAPKMESGEQLALGDS